MTDEECIALAALHGCGFHKSLGSYWTATEWHTNPHPIEVGRPGGVNAFKSREELARTYCKYYGLIP